jgi:hypothetical protein
LLDFEIHYDAVEHGDLHIHNMFKPVPAVSVLPEWFKRMTTNDSDDQNLPTVKQCKGVWDILSSGYMILWPFDVEIFKNENGKLDIIKSRSMNKEGFYPHPHRQLEGINDINIESQEHGIQKIHTPYRIKTPPGTSMLMMQPPYRPDLRTTVMPGMIDTDKYYGELNVLFLLNDFSGRKKIKIKSGTPLAQIIPFVRGEWNTKYDKINKEEFDIAEEFALNTDKFYQRYLWTRKVFKDEGNSKSSNRN